MRVALFGAIGPLGRRVLDQLLERDHEVKVLVGDPTRLARKSEKLTVIAGDTEDAEKVGEAIAGCEAVIDTLGVRANTEAEVQRLLKITEIVLATMREQGVPRFIGVGGAGIDAPGDKKGMVYRLVAWFSKLTAHHVVEEKQKEFELVRRSGLDWTMVRVPFITEGEMTQKYRASLTRPPSSRISRADIAFVLVTQLEDRRFVRKAPFVGS
ncbi:MAG: NAD(P)H-binding protein [Thaumarchaeota archaeon]|nr:NAD(P)H-binding protein [Nitrososphaerota archaeon]